MSQSSISQGLSLGEKAPQARFTSHAAHFVPSIRPFTSPKTTRQTLDGKVREFNPRYTEAGGALPGLFRNLHSDIYGNREFVGHLRNRGKFFDHEGKRERDLILIEPSERTHYEL